VSSEQSRPGEKAARPESPRSNAKNTRSGLDDAIDNADPWTWESGLDLIEVLARSGRPFTADNVTASGLVFDHPCRIGALFHIAHEAGIIRRLGYAPSTRTGRNGSVVSIWVGGENAK
jgi:hypothetical protein